MPNVTSKATILNINQSMSPTSDNAIGFCKPMFEDIFVFSSELAASMTRPPYYGDEINLGFWASLNMNFGAPSTNTVKIVCIGDSLTYGYGASSTSASWPDVWAGLTGYTIINKGISGETSGQMFARFQQDVIALQPDYCIIECGTNDFIQGVLLQACKNNIDDMVSLCLANNIEPRFVHYIQRTNQLQMLVNAGLYSGSITDFIQYLEDVWTYEQSLGYKCKLFNADTDLDPNNAAMMYFYNSVNDYIHPNDAGYHAWATGIHASFVDISSSTQNSNIYGLHNGWKYKYYYNQKKFVIEDENGSIILEKNHVVDISQFPIDFSVHKSHQFEIIISDASSTSTFYIPTGLIKKTYGDSPTVNNGKVPIINNVYLPNYYKPPVPEGEGVPPTIVVIGSSLCAPYPQYNQPYPAWSFRFEEVSGYHVINKGIGGNSTEQMLERFWTDVISYHPDYCIMEVGVNDAQDPLRHPIDSTKASVHTMLNLCLMNDIEPIFVVCLPAYNSMYGGGNYSVINNARILQADLRDYIIGLGYTVYPYEEALETSVGYIDLNLTFDNTHPNSQGNKLIGDKLYTYMNNLVKTHDYTYTTPENAKIVVIGDSISAGSPYTGYMPGEPPNDYASWTATFRNLSNYRVINQAIGGTNSDDTVARFMTDVVALDPDYVIFEHGNDALWGLNQFYRTESNLTTIAQMCSTNNIKLIFIQPVGRLNMPAYAPASQLPDIVKYLHKMHEFETNLGYPSLVGYYTPISIMNTEGHPSDIEVNQALLADGVHPTLQGYEIVGRWLTPQILLAMSEKEEVQGSNNKYRIEQVYDVYMEFILDDARWELVKYPSTIGGIRGHVDVDYINHAIPTSQMYGDNFIPFHAIKQTMTFTTQMLQYRWTLALLSVTLFPALCPTLMPGEMQNNRPVYEPWLIWGVLKFLGNKEFGGPYYPWDDEDTPNIDVLDGISPNWSY